MSAETVLTSTRLNLLPLPPAHADLLARRERDPAWAPDYPQPTDLDAARHLFESGLLYADDGGLFGVWLIVELADGAVIGTIGFDGPPQGGALQIFYGIVPSRRGRGLASEALNRLTEYAGGRPEVHSIEAYAQSDASAAVLRRAGYGSAGDGTAGDERYPLGASLFTWGVSPSRTPADALPAGSGE